MRSIYVYTDRGLGKLVFYVPDVCYPYLVEYCVPKSSTFSVTIYGQKISNVNSFSRDEIKFLHEKPLRYIIERRKNVQCR